VLSQVNRQFRRFAGSLRIRGDFGEDARLIVDYYRVEYHRDGMAPGTWVDLATVPGLLGAFSRADWDFATVDFSPPIPFGPTTVDGRTVYKTRYKYERDNPGAPGGAYLWDDWDTLFLWNTHNQPESDGLYSFRLVGYRQAAGGTLVDERVMPLCGTEDEPVPVEATLMVRLDNQNVPHVPSVPAHPCDIVTIADTGTITIQFLAIVPATAQDGHLLAYEMSAHYGESAVFTALAAGTLAANPTVHFGPTSAIALTQGPPGSIERPYWYGGNFKLTPPGTAFPESCAYLLPLRAWKRTTDGCTDPYYFHANVCEFSFCVIKPTKPPP
jgi:hypothetical protein